MHLFPEYAPIPNHPINLRSKSRKANNEIYYNYSLFTVLELELA